MVKETSVPFYLMISKEIIGNPAKYPDDPHVEISGLEEAIRNTEKSLTNYKKDGSNTSELDFHLAKLKQQLEKAKKKI